MKTQKNTSTDDQVKQSPNYILAIYIVFITALVLSYATATAIKVL